MLLLSHQGICGTTTRYFGDTRLSMWPARDTVLTLGKRYSINTNPFILWTPVEAPRDTIVMLYLVGSIGS